MPKGISVNPNGDLIATHARGQYLGNRGVLHNAQGKLGSKRWTHQQWIYCLQELKTSSDIISAPTGP